jgi:hypothetical protein
MNLAIIYELRAANVEEADIELIMNRVKNRLSEENIDKELVKMGYPKIFTLDCSEFDNYDYNQNNQSSNKGGFSDLD